MSNLHEHRPRRLFYRGFASHDHVDIEDGSDEIGLAIEESFRTRLCPNCNSALRNFVNAPSDVASKLQKLRSSPETQFLSIWILFLCRDCGWWQLRCTGLINLDGRIRKSQFAYKYHSLLEEIDISSNEIPLADLKAYLIRKWEDRRFISASKAEDLVADVLRDYFACDVHHATANVNAADGGIDLFVCFAGGHVKAAVQVKRRVTRSVELVHEVRNFVGALIVEGYHKGVFVTTASRFSEGAQKMAAAPTLQRHKLELDLIDGERLLDLLKATSPTTDLHLPEGIDALTLWRDNDGSVRTTMDLLSAETTPPI